MQSTSRRDSGIFCQCESVERYQGPGQDRENSDREKDRRVDLALLEIVPFIAGFSTAPPHHGSARELGICDILKVTEGIGR